MNIPALAQLKSPTKMVIFDGAYLIALQSTKAYSQKAALSSIYSYSHCIEFDSHWQLFSPPTRQTYNIASRRPYN